MRSYRMGVPLLVCLLAVPGWSQQAPSSQSSQAQTPAQRDPQAVSVVSQALAAAGGTAAINAITDYTATGTIVSDQGLPSQDSVTINGRGRDELRKDTVLTSGTSSLVINSVLTSTKGPNGLFNIRTMPTPFMAGNLAMPYRELAAIAGNSQFNLTNEGVVQVGGESLYDIRAQFAPTVQQPQVGSAHVYHSADFFIDVSTFQLRMVQDLVPTHATPRTITYSDYRVANGVLVPFQIDENVGGQPISIIQLNQFAANVGLQDSTFEMGNAGQ